MRTALSKIHSHFHHIISRVATIMQCECSIIVNISSRLRAGLVDDNVDHWHTHTPSLLTVNSHETSRPTPLAVTRHGTLYNNYYTGFHAPGHEVTLTTSRRHTHCVYLTVHMVNICVHWLIMHPPDETQSTCQKHDIIYAHRCKRHLTTFSSN